MGMDGLSSQLVCEERNAGINSIIPAPSLLVSTRSCKKRFTRVDFYAVSVGYVLSLSSFKGPPINQNCYKTFASYFFCGKMEVTVKQSGVMAKILERKMSKARDQSGGRRMG